MLHFLTGKSVSRLILNFIQCMYIYIYTVNKTDIA